MEPHGSRSLSKNWNCPQFLRNFLWSIFNKIDFYPYERYMHGGFFCHRRRPSQQTTNQHTSIFFNFFATPSSSTSILSQTRIQISKIGVLLSWCVASPPLLVSILRPAHPSACESSSARSSSSPWNRPPSHSVSSASHQPFINTNKVGAKLRFFSTNTEVARKSECICFIYAW